MTGPDFLEPQRHRLHDKDSHDKDGSKELMYNQIVLVVEIVKTAPTLSGAVLSRNLLDHYSPSKNIPQHGRISVGSYLFVIARLNLL